GLHRAGVLVRPAVVGEEAIDGQVDLGAAGFDPGAGHGVEAARHLLAPGGEVFGDVKEDLRLVVGRGLRPACSGLARGLHRIADVLAVALPHLAGQSAIGSHNLARVLAVRAALLAADVHLGGAVDRRQHRRSAVIFRVLLVLAVLVVPFRPRLSGLNLPPWLQVLPEPFLAALAAEAALAVAAEAGGGVEEVGAVDPYRAGLDLGRQVESEVDVLGPDARREAVAGVVRQLDGLLRRAEGHGDEHRAEDLDLGDGVRRRHFGEQGRLIEPAVPRAAPGGLPELGAFLDSLAHQPLDALELHRRDDSADIDGLVSGVSHPQGLHASAEPGIDRLGDALLDDQARAGAADLSLVEPDGVHHALDRAVEVGVVEDHEGGLAAELQGELLAGARRGLADEAADLGGTGEGELVDV